MENKKTLRNFGLTVGGVFVVIGVAPLVFKGHEIRIWSLVLGFCLIVFGLFLPLLLEKPYKLWMKFGHFLMTINTKIILTVMFFLIICPISVILRLWGKDFLGMKKTGKTFWVVRESIQDEKRFERQF